ncbi:MAG: hypothetical protein FJ042_02120 [Candidatus Cloacimonetes bacterium]|nr:hypothetical protein [Candidatus Cloacimonadota bacterium]
MTHNFFFKINLNKFGEMKVQQERERKTFIRATVSFVILMLILCGGVYYLNSQLSRKLNNRVQYLNKINDQIESFQTSGDYLSTNDLDRLAATFNDRIFWAKKLVALAHEINDKLAVFEFSYASGILTLNGITPVDASVREVSLINEFIQRLKNNPEISNDFPQIKSGAFTRERSKDTDILKFVIECYATETRKGGAR